MVRGQLIQIGGAILIIVIGWLLAVNNQTHGTATLPIPLNVLSPTPVSTKAAEVKPTFIKENNQNLNVGLNDCPAPLTLSGNYTCETDWSPETVFDWFVTELEKRNYNSLSKVRIKTNGEYNYQITASKETSVRIQIKKKPDSNKTTIQFN